MHILNTLAPVFILIGLGAALYKTRFLSDDLVDGLTRVAYWVGLPCILFYKVASADYDYSVASKAFVIFITGFLLAVIVAYIVAYAMKIPFNITGTFVHGSFHANLSFVGFAVIVFHLSNSGMPAERIDYIESLAAIMMILGVISNNTFAVTVLLISQKNFGFHSAGSVLKGLITNPLIVSSILGLIYSALFKTLPEALGISFEAIGQLALPAALLAIGATLIRSKITANLSRAVAASVIKVGVAPMIGAATAHLIGLEKDYAMVPMVLLACPTAVASFVVSSRLGGKPELTTAIIVISTVLSIASLSTVLALY